MVLALGEMADDVFDHDDGTVDDEAEVDSAEGHEIAADAPVVHAGDGEEER